jgi:acyl-homoserine-lactone acylase
MVQGVHRNGQFIPLPGGPADPNGEFNAMLDNYDVGPDFVAGKGFPEVNMGSSFIQAVSWNNGACPVGGTVLTYSQSDDPENPHYADQTRLFSQQRWVPDRFCTASVLQDTKRTRVLERAR